VGNTAEVTGECHGATEELGDVEEALDDGWRRLSTVVCSAAHDTEENRSRGSRPPSMAAGCQFGEVHHVGGVLGEVPAGMA
jgi:hypothetical protein